MAESLLLETYKQHRKELLGFLTRRLHCRFTAQDLAQNLYLRLSNLDTPNDLENSRAYLFRMAANLATDYQRVENRRQELLHEIHPDDEEPVSTAISPERMAIAGEQLQQVQQQLAKLPELSRKIFYATRFEGKTQKQLAAELGVSTTTIENHIKRVFSSLRNLRDQFEE